MEKTKAKLKLVPPGEPQRAAAPVGKRYETLEEILAIIEPIPQTPETRRARMHEVGGKAAAKKRGR